LISNICFSAQVANELIETKPQSNTVCRAEVRTIQIAKETELSLTGLPVQAKWSDVESLPDQWNKRWPNYQGNAWYRVRWNYECPEEQWSPLSLMVGSISMAGEIFVNGHLLWQSKSLTAPLSMSWNMPRQWLMLPAGLKQGENETLIRVIPNHILSPGMGEIFIGNSSEIKPLYERIWFEKRGTHIYTLIFELVLAVLALLIWIFRPQEKAFGWYSLCTFFWIIYIGNNLLTEPFLFLDATAMARVDSIVFLLFTWTTCLYSWRFANKKFRSFERSYWGILALGILLITFVSEAYLKPLLNVSFVVGFGCYMINCLIFPWIAFKSKRLDAMLLGGVMILIYFPLGVHDGWYMFTHDGTLLSPYASPFTTIILAAIFALRLTDSMKRIELFNQTLKSTVVKVKTELLESVGKTHQLELKNAKLHERIQLAHDLHDGLGGSLVRSMSLVEQKEGQLNKAQVLSMLKHLRDDLRQIIDTSSSLDARCPETPVIWLAPIRHRFNQLFDELDVHIRWNLPEKWVFEVGTSDCFAYQRVLEEALTNVVKHSYATEVCIRLKFHSDRILSLHIEDNGIGFDTCAVDQAGLSVGMRSMQSRMQKIQADCKISSESGKTVLCILKKYSD
jgi:signal transduction histidine kinase